MYIQIITHCKVQGLLCVYIHLHWIGKDVVSFMDMHFCVQYALLLGFSI